MKPHVGIRLFEPLNSLTENRISLIKEITSLYSFVRVLLFLSIHRAYTAEARASLPVKLCKDLPPLHSLDALATRVFQSELGQFVYA